MREKTLDIPDIRGFMRINKLVIALEKIILIANTTSA
jgi:hypothetical protein